MKYVFIVNSFTLGNKCKIICNKIEKYCMDKKLDYVIEINDTNNSTENIIKKYKNSDNIIFAVGGDGMINRVLNSIVDTNNILGVIPSGTGNDFYKSIKLEFSDGINECDLIKINDKYFINVACFGIDADIANDSTIIKSKLLKKYKYIFNLVKHFYKYKNRTFSICLEDKIIKDRFVTVVLCNGRFYGGGFNIGPSAKLNNGTIDVYMVKDVNKLKMLKLILLMKNGKHENNKDIDKYRVKKLVIKAKNNIKCNIDGEVFESKKFDIKVVEKKLKIYYNQKMIDSIRG